MRRTLPSAALMACLFLGSAAVAHTAQDAQTNSPAASASRPAAPQSSPPSQMGQAPMAGQMGPSGMMGDPQMQTQMSQMMQDCPCCKRMAEMGHMQPQQR